MSTGLECCFVEVEPGSWFYVLQNWDCPAQTWDWREFATGYGPFESLEAAREHLRSNHANPGGHSVRPYDADAKPDEVELALLAEARR